MSDNVVALPGSSLPLAAEEPDPEVVAVLEQWLADAKSGRLKAVALAGTNSDRFRASAWAVAVEWQNDLAAAVMGLNHRFGSFIYPEHTCGK